VAFPFNSSNLKMKAKGFLDFSMDRLTERNKENSFLDVDWIISELITKAKNRLDIETREAASLNLKVNYC